MTPNIFKRIFAIGIVSIISVFIQPIARAASVSVDTRQTTNTNGPSAGWTFVGCFTDTGGDRTPSNPLGGARTLQAQSLTSSTGMTPAMCFEFCSNFTFPYGFAGVESGQECWCDGVIQLIANLTDSSECNVPCTGDDTLKCGGSKHISIYTDGTPSPKIPAVATRPEPLEDALPVGLWQYAGCYSDSAVSRTLKREVSQGVVNDANTCAAACEDTFPEVTQLPLDVNSGENGKYVLFSGVESGGECWCDTSISSTAQRLPDIACASIGCHGVNDQACGGDFVIAVYQYNALLHWQDCEDLPGPNSPFSTPFQLNAVFVDEPSTSVPITMASIIEQTNPWSTTTAAGILSHCPTCPNPITFTMNTDSQWELKPINIANTAINNLTVIHPAGTVNFVEITDDDRLFVGYCFMPSIIHKELLELTPFGLHVVPPLAVASPNVAINQSVPFTLCSNLTAGGRLDIVYKPLTFQTGYNLTDCRDVVLEISYNVTVQD